MASVHSVEFRSLLPGHPGIIEVMLTISFHRVMEGLGV